MVKYFFSFLFCLSFHLKALPLDDILKANDATSLKSYIKQYKHQKFLEILCEKQKENRKPAIACYELSLNVDSWCFSLKMEDLNLEILNQALKSKFLSFPCRKYLEEKLEILIYRKKDFLLPELKNYWTSQKLFL